ncbi:tail fiber domain-containing protein [Spirillospora sp. CA-253888]
MKPFGWGRGRRRSVPAPVPQVAAAGSAPVNGHDVLAKVADLPISTWRYLWEPEHVRHLGPMAQDWNAAFGLGEHDFRIEPVDASGVALVAIQALQRRITELEQQVSSLQQAQQRTH